MADLFLDVSAKAVLENLKRACVAVALLGLFGAGCAAPSPTVGLRLNQIQVIGTHNSYHQRASAPLLKLIGLYKPEAVRELDYEHRPLAEQLSRLCIRQIELDCYADPDGGRFAQPLGPRLAGAAGFGVAPTNSSVELLKPGIKVMHIPDVDYGTSVLTLVDGLRETLEWSQAHPRHVPVFILIELKSETVGAGFTKALPWDESGFAELEREILSVFPRQFILTPDDIRGGAATLREGLQAHGWPALDSARGVMFGLDNGGGVRDAYLRGHPSLEGRLLFVSVSPANPAAAWMERNDPIADFADIQRLVREGFLVRTRADEPTEQARANDTRMRDRALASGAQFISTDFPEPDPKFSPYCVQLPGRRPARVNPVNGPANTANANIE